MNLRKTQLRHKQIQACSVTISTAYVMTSYMVPPVHFFLNFGRAMVIAHG